MYDIKQFRPALYVLILLGFLGFALASEVAGLWAFCTLLVLANAWFIKIDLFKPLPRWVASAVTIIAFLYVFLPAAGRNNLILVAGQILVLLQVVKVWEQRGNRDYAQLLVLSLLLMVAAAISTASLLFGVIFFVYLLLSLYCCLLFHLKVETDEARIAMALPEKSVNPATLRQDQRHLPRSMRRLTGLVAVFAITFAVLVFVLFPRGTGAGMFGQIPIRQPDPLTGFSEHVDFQTVAKLTQNDAEVAQVQFFKDGKLQGFNGTIYLRGTTLDIYNGSDNSEQPKYQWDRNITQFDPTSIENTVPKTTFTFSNASANYLEKIDLNPIGTPTIFSVAGAVSITPETIFPNHQLTVRYSPIDQTLTWSEPPTQRTAYTITYNNAPNMRRADAVRVRSRIDPLIAEYARRPEVSGGLDEKRRALPTTNRSSAASTEYDEEIARRIETHLRTNFLYTLDLTDASRMAGRDPIVAFLYDFKKGHCEYFAGAMTLLCQSLGLNARMVVGFKCDEFNPLGHYYNVRQSHAHAWVEVFTDKGWETFDPTSGREVGSNSAGLWQKTRQLLDFLEYTWQNTVIAYDADNRENLLQNVDTRLTRTADRGSVTVSTIQKLFYQWTDIFANKVVAPLIGILTVALVGSIGWFFYERIKLRRRASRIGIELLPPSDQFRLVRQLAFYDELLQLLHRHQIVRPRHLTPQEFSDQLSFLPSEVYDTVHRLTQIFYRIRYGKAELDLSQQRRLSIIVFRLNQTLAHPHSLTK